MYSKFRPPSGLRLMLQPGPSTRETPAARASLPMASPSAAYSSRFQEAPAVTAVGKQVAGRDLFTPSISPSPFWQRRPWGPSAIIMAGTPHCGSSFVCQKSAPVQKAIFSRRDISEKIFSVFNSFPSPIILCYWYNSTDPAGNACILVSKTL